MCLGGRYIYHSRATAPDDDVFMNAISTWTKNETVVFLPMYSGTKNTITIMPSSEGRYWMHLLLVLKTMAQTNERIRTKIKKQKQNTVPPSGFRHRNTKMNASFKEGEKKEKKRHCSYLLLVLDVDFALNLGYWAFLRQKALWKKVHVTMDKKKRQNSGSTRVGQSILIDTSSSSQRKKTNKKRQ